MDPYAEALGFGGPAASAPPGDPYAAALGFSTKPKAKKGGAEPVPVPGVDVAGAPLLAQSPATQAAVLADVKKTGAQNFTVNGAAPDATVAPVVVAPVAPSPVVAVPAAEVPWWQKVRAGGEAGLSAITGAVGGSIGGLAAGGNAAVKQVLYGATGQPLPPELQGPNAVSDAASRGAAALTYTPSTPLGQEYAGKVGQFVSDVGAPLTGLAPELAGISRLAPAAAQQVAGSRSMEAMRASFDAKKGVPVEAARVEPTAGPADATATAAAPAKFADSAPSVSPGGALPAAEQARRTQVLASVGIGQARKSAIAGDAKAAATDAQMAKVDSPSGNVMRAQLDSEKAALANHADELVKETGGTQGLDQSTLFGRGNTIVAPLDALKEHFDAQTSALYKAADERAQGVPADMPKTHDFIGGDQAEFLGTTEGEQLLKGVKARMKSLGMADADGNPTAATVQQAEQLKQYLNNQWQPRTSRLIRGMKDAIDDDVTQAAGDDVYQAARQMRAQRSATLDNPNGIAKIMDSSGPDGVNRSVPIEKIPDAIAGMPVQQFSHIVETLKNAPEEIQPQSTAALAEIKSHFANKVQAIGTSQAGQWNAGGVTKFLNNNSERMAQVFTPEEMAQFRNLNDAGHILSKDQSYPGAAVQQHNLVRTGVAAGLTSGGGAVGGALGGPAGAAVGSWLGSKAGTAINDASSLRAASKRLTSLKDVGK